MNFAAFARQNSPSKFQLVAHATIIIAKFFNLSSVVGKIDFPIVTFPLFKGEGGFFVAKREKDG